MKIKLTENQLSNLIKVMKEEDILVGKKHTLFGENPMIRKVWLDILGFINSELSPFNDQTKYVDRKTELMKIYNSTSTDKTIEDRVFPYFKKLGYKYPSKDVMEFQKQLGTTTFINVDEKESDFVDGIVGVSTIKMSLPIIVQSIDKIIKTKGKDYTYGQNRKDMERNKELISMGKVTDERKKGIEQKRQIPKSKKTSKIGVGTQSIPKT